MPAALYILQEILIFLVSGSWALIYTLVVIIITFWQSLLGTHADWAVAVDPPLLPPVDLLPLGPVDPPQPPQRPNHHYHKQLHQMFAAQHHRKNKRILNISQHQATSRQRIMLPPLVKSAIKADLEYAKKLHEATTGLPARMDTFHSQYGLNVYSGLDARKAAFHSHLATGHRKPMLYSNILFPPAHPTHPSELPVPHLFDTAIQTTIDAKEFPVTSGGPGYLVEGDKGPARILLSEGPHFEAIISHDPTLPAGVSGWSDHYQAAHRWISLHEYFTENTFIC